MTGWFGANNKEVLKKIELIAQKIKFDKFLCDVCIGYHEIKMCEVCNCRVCNITKLKKFKNYGSLCLCAACMNRVAQSIGHPIAEVRGLVVVERGGFSKDEYVEEKKISGSGEDVLILLKG